MTDHPEKRGERNPLTSRKLRQNLLKNRFVPKKKQEVKSPEEPKELTKNQDRPVEPTTGL